MIRGVNKINTNIRSLAKAFMPTKWGDFHMYTFAVNEDEKMPHIALVHESMDKNEPVLTRIHSECITGDLFGSMRCDCGEQLEMSLIQVSKEGGIIVYLRQEGRGIGLINKLKAYNNQDQGMNTIEANTHLGLEPDARQYDIALKILNSFDIDRIRLLTNNPEKIHAFDHSSIKVLERVPLLVEPNPVNLGYLKTKKDEMGHILDL